MNRFVILFCIFTILLTACGSATPTAVPTATQLPAPTVIPSPVPGVLYVDPSIDLGPISPLIFGSNYGPWLVVSVDMLPAAYDSGVTILRFPAGSWGDHNDVKTYQIDQFVDFIGRVGATAMINVRLLGGTPEQAAEMVRYTNIEKKYNVQYWGIGNEPTLYDGEVRNFGETYDAKQFNEEWRAFAIAMKNVDPTIKLVGPESHQLSYDYAPGASTNFSEANAIWFADFLKANGDLVDIVSFHRYPFPVSSTSGAASIDELRKNAREWDKIINYAREVVHRETGRDLPIAITEFNSDYSKAAGGEATPDSHFNAIWMADVLGRMIKNGVFMANQWGLTAKAGYGGLGLIAQSDVFPSYYVYQMYKMFGDELIYSSSDDPDLSVYAARNTEGALTVIIINLSLEEKSRAIRIEGQAATQAEVWLFDPTHPAESVGMLDISGTPAFPPQSMTLFIIRWEQ